MDENLLWSFDTANFSVRLTAEPEDLDPADSFDDPRDIEDVREGRVEWFAAKVAVLYRGAEIAADHLGGCAYARFRDFYTDHRAADPMQRNCSIFKAAHPNTCIGSYFTDMVREAVREARKAMADAPRLRRVEG